MLTVWEIILFGFFKDILHKGGRESLKAIGLGKDKIVTVHDIMAGSGGIAPLTLNLGTRWM